VASDDDLLALRQPQIAREIILHLGQGHPTCLG
jgi:hypothetical protein